MGQLVRQALALTRKRGTRHPLWWTATTSLMWRMIYLQGPWWSGTDFWCKRSNVKVTLLQNV